MASITRLDFDRPEGAEPSVSLLDLLPLLARRKRFIALVTAAATAVTAAVAFLIPPAFTAEAVIFPPQQEPSTQPLMMGPFAGLGGLGALGGASGAAGLWRNPADLYIGVLKSRTIADALIARFRLQQVYGRSDLSETRKVLDLPGLAIAVTALRVPVFYGHSLSVNVVTRAKLRVPDAREVLRKAPGLKVLDDPGERIYPMPMLATNDDAVHVGRIREDASHERGLALFVAVDNVRKGAALNLVQIAEVLAAKHL